MSNIYLAFNLRKTYGPELVVHMPEFSLEKGASLILTGPNGSGKSTFLRMLAFIEAPSHGKLEFLGSGEPRKNCTLLLQEAWLLNATVFQNVVLGLKLRGLQTCLQEQYHEAMRAVGFTNPQLFSKRKSGSLSGGERQRVALASRLIINPQVLLLDEPTSYVDEQSANCIIDNLRKKHEDGTTIICATHDTLLAKRLGGRIMKMKKAI